MSTVAPPRRPETTPSGDPEALIPEARARQRQRRARIALAAIVLIGLGASMFAIFGGGATQPLTALSIPRHVASSISQSGGLMLNMANTSRANPTVERSLRDFTTGSATRAIYVNGVRQSALRAFPVHGEDVHPRRLKWLTIDFVRDKWSSTTFGPVPHAHTMPSVACQCAALFNGTVPASRIVFLGEVTIDGQSTFHLRLLPAPHVPATDVFSPGISAGIRPLTSTPATETFDFWISTATYLPVHETVAVGHTVVVRRTLTWLPRTPANLAKLVVAIPAGFKQTH